MESTSLYLLLFLLLPCITTAGDAEALLALKSAVDINNKLDYQQTADICKSWTGVKQCFDSGRVTKLILESLNLTGTLASSSLSSLDQIRVLSLKSNSLTGPIPDLSYLRNLKSLYLGSNRFTGAIPASIAGLHRIKIIDLDNNRLSGEIPAALAAAPRLYLLLLQNNKLTGEIPPFAQPGLRFFNVSGNDLSGEIPPTLSRFNSSSFFNNPRLCGQQVRRSNCLSPSPSPSPISDLIVTVPPSPGTGSSHRRLVRIVAGSVAGGVLLLICMLAVIVIMCKKSSAPAIRPGGGDKSPEVNPAAAAATAAVGGGDGGGGGLKWEGQEGRLEFVGGAGEMYGLEELLRASAEAMGRGTVGSTYKAVLETGFIVTVKRLREVGAGAGPHAAAEKEFRRRMEEIGRLRHPNVVALRAYFQAKEERLLVYDYFPNGSLFTLIHGSKPSGSGKPLHWTSCLKIAEDVAAGLLYLHQSDAVHGNLKSSNVLLGPDFEACLTDYALLPYLHSSAAPSAALSSALYFRAPESRHPDNPIFTSSSDVYCFGLLLLELLTGKTPFQDLVDQHCADIPRWVRSMREESAESNGDDHASEEKLSALLNIATTCVAVAPEGRPVIGEVLRMVREARADSSNGSEHSPGRWSDTVQSLPREYGSEHLSFAERD